MSIRTISHRSVVTLLALGLTSLGAPLVLAGTAAGSANSLCRQLSAPRVAKALDLKVTGETTVSNGDVAVCWYRVGANSQAVFIRTQANDSVSGLRADRANATKQGEHPKTDLHFKPESAFSTSIGSATYGSTYSVTVLKKRTEVSVGAVHTTLVKVEALTRLVLPLV